MSPYSRELLAQQQSLVDLIFTDKANHQHEHAAALNIYRNNLRATASQALAISYPTVRKLIGESMFSHLSEKLLSTAPPAAGDWALWGEDLADLLVKTSALDGFPYVVDSALLDWSIHTLERVANQPFEQSSLQLLRDVDLDNLIAEPSQSTKLLEANYPVIEVWHSNHSTSADLYIDAFKRRVELEQYQQAILLYRPEYKVQFIELNEIELFWYQGLIDKKPLGILLDQIEHVFGHQFSFESWLPAAIENNIIHQLAIAEPG